MTLRWRRLGPREIDHELLWLSVAGAALCGLAVALATPGIRLPQCVFRLATGLPCPTCGMTRAVLALAHGDWAHAWIMNPLVVLTAAGGAFYALYAALVLGARLPRLRPVLTVGDARFVRLCGVAVVLANWAWLIASGR